MLRSIGLACSSLHVSAHLLLAHNCKTVSLNSSAICSSTNRLNITIKDGENMWIKALGFIVIGASVSPAFAWEDVEYTGTLKRGAVYCSKASKLEELGGYSLDGDAAAVDRMIARGDCVIAQNPIRAEVFQEDSDRSCFFLPSGKIFYTFTAFISK